MTPPILEVRGVSKAYPLEAPRGAPSLRESLASLVRPDRWRRGGGRTFLALRGVSFEVPEGQSVGVVGRNGAGKSTLLRVLSRITAPTAGEVRVHGTVASLLEVGTGFHPELTGRENVYLSGTTLGMSRAEIRRRFDEIVSFAGVEAFLDAPVKRYSSGMYLRLAFSVAAHLRADILLLDEVMAVGDVAFRKRCVEKMSDVLAEGRTTLLVSHNLDEVARFCSRAVLLHEGAVAADGPVREVLRSYLEGAAGESPSAVDFGRPGQAGAAATLVRAELLVDGRPASYATSGQSIVVQIDYRVEQPSVQAFPWLSLHHESGCCVLSSGAGGAPAEARPGLRRARAVLPVDQLTSGLFSLDLALVSAAPPLTHAHERQVLHFHLHAPEPEALLPELAAQGVLRARVPWQDEPVE